MNLNLKIVVGRLGRDPEIRYLPDGTMAMSFNVATNTYYKKNNEYKEIATWHSVKIFGKLAEYLSNKNIRKGDLVFVLGEDREERWRDKNNIERISRYIRAEKVSVIGKFSNGDKNIVNEGIVQNEENNTNSNNNSGGASNADAEQGNYDDLPF